MLSRRAERALLLLTIALGFGLRLHTLGRDGLWLDEAGQALAVLQPTLAGMVAIERTHAMAMPLDYAIARLFATLGATEFVLRLPAALWGTLSIPLLAGLGRRVAGRPAAALAAFFLAVSPLFVRYAQELRFYAALVAFFLLSAVLLIDAFARPSRRRWLAYLAVTALGAYLHPYVLLTAAGGLIYALLPGSATGVQRATRRDFLLAAALAGLLFLPGYWLFGAHQAYAFDLLQWGGTLSSVTRQGLDWTGLAGATPLLARLAYGFSAGFALLGAAVALARWRRYPWLAALLLAVAVDVAAIIITTRLKGYWYLSRQLLPLAAVAALLTAFGLMWLMGVVAGRRAAGRRALAAALVAVAVLLVGLAAGQSLAASYARPKSLAREAAAALAEAHARRETILVIPGFDRQLYQFYLTRPRGLTGDTTHLVSTEWAELPAALPPTGPAYLVVRGAVSDAQRAALIGWGFTTLIGPGLARDGTIEVFARGTG